MPNLTDTHKQTHKADKLPFQWQFLHPRYWGVWLAMMVVLPLIYLPLRVQFFFGTYDWHIGVSFGQKTSSRHTDQSTPCVSKQK